MADAYPSVTDLVPHRGKMLVIDAVKSWDGGVLVCEATVAGESIFVDESGQTPAMLALEQMAQTCAAFMGLRARESNEPVCIGYLLGCRSLELLTDVLTVGDSLSITVEQVGALQTMASFDCRVTRGEQAVATGVLNVMYADTP
ncbi:MAG: hypothetical protein ACPG4T_19020, partial [Nannocystaceae bacterium]